MKMPAQNTIETRDAVLWDLQLDQRVCRVKIQGSNEYIIAHFPQSWDSIPPWMKAGNAVRITHMGGVRGRVEVVGCGQMIPLPVAGGTFPTPETLSDTVLTGGHVGPSTPNAMSVDVAAATYRIGEVEYNSAATTLTIDAAPAVGQYRYDAIYGDTSGTVHVAKGTAAYSDPVMPSIPANTVQLGYVLVYGGMTAITPTYTNREWAAEFPAKVTVVPDDDDLAWTELSTTVTVSVFDQYGNPYSEGAPGLYLTLEFQTTGNGTLHSDEEGDSTTKIGAHTGAGQNHYHFLYTRDQLATDLSLSLKGTNETTRTVSGYGAIILRDEDGNVMAGESGSPPYEIPTAYDTVQEEGTPLTKRTVINFIGAGVTAEDDAVNEVTKVTIPSGGHAIQDEGTPLAQQPNLNFVGAGVTATNDAGNNATKVTIPGGGGSGDVVGPAVAVDSNACEFDTTTGKLIKDGGLTHANLADAVTKKHVAATAGVGLDIAGQELSIEERNANLALFPEYAGATMSPSGANNNPGIYGMTSDFEAVGTAIHNYYEWKSSITTGLQSYDINVKIPMPFNFTGFQAGVSVALTLDIKTEENTITNNKIDIILQKDGSATTSSLTDQKSASAATWVAVGFDETDAILAALVAGDILNVTIRMYSQNSKYARIGKINLQLKLQ